MSLNQPEYSARVKRLSSQQLAAMSHFAYLTPTRNTNYKTVLKRFAQDFR